MNCRNDAEFRRPRVAIVLATFALCCALSCPKVVALDIQLSYSGGFENRPDAVAAMEAAAGVWETLLADPVVVEIDVQEVSILELPFGAQGGAFPNWYEETYTDVRAALVQDQSSADDELAISGLPAGPTLLFQTWDAEQNPVINEGDAWINNWLLMPRAQLKALGLPLEGVDPDPDAEILWSEFFLDRIFDFDRSDGIDGTDFQAVAVHEIGHALGFGSGTDSFDQLHAGLLTITPEEINDFSVLFPLDLFRYSTQSPTLIDVTPGNDAYFSINSGTTSLGSFATGESFGDGWQAGHWKAASGQGIMDANLPDDEIHNLTSLDLRAMDIIGWDLAQTGDYDLDQDVDGEDFLIWQREYGSLEFSPADGNHDGQVHAADYVVWRDRFGTGVAFSELSLSVPEPASQHLAILVVAIIVSGIRLTQ